MKILSVLFILIVSVNTFANESYHEDWMKKMDNMSFEEAKKMKLEMLDSKSTMMEQERKCVVATNDKSSLRECMTEMKDMKKEMMDKTKK
jgi:hypothetical protein